MGSSIITLSISSKYFGVSIDRDQWVLAMGFILVLDLAIWGPINETFRAKFVFLQHEIGDKEVIEKVRSMFSFINFITLVLVVIILIYPRALTSIIAPSYNKMQLAHLTKMVLILTPSFLLNQICQFMTSVLNAHNTFYIPEAAGLATAVLNIILIIVLAPRFGIYALAFGYYLGVLLLFLLLLIQMRKLKINLIGNPFKFKFNDVKPFILFALPFYLPYFLAQVNSVVEKSIASTLNVGIVSIIDYSRKFSDSAISVLTSVFFTMLLPLLSQYYSKKDDKRFLVEFKSMYQLSFLIITFIVGIFSGCPGAIIGLFYNKGNITADALNKISNMSMFYSWSAVPITLYILLGVVLLSSDNGRVYAIFGSVAQVIMILINLLFNKIFGIYTFPFSLFISHIIASAFLFHRFPIKNHQLFLTTIKGIAQIALCSFVLYYLNQKISMLHQINSLFIIVLNITMIGLFLLIFSHIAKTNDKETFMKIISKIKAG